MFVCKQALTLVLLSSVGQLAAQDWSGFRGPAGNGLGGDYKAPTSWKPGEKLWQLPLPRPGNGSPIIANGMLFVTSAQDPKGLRRTLYCVDTVTGKKKWEQSVRVKTEFPTHRTNPYCGTTPASDGKRVVVWHGSGGLHCYDLQGKPLWKRELGEFRHQWGYGTSPVIHQDHVILHTGPGAKSFVAAFSLETGATIWQTEEPSEGDGEKNDRGKYMGSWCTPVVTSFGGQEQVICMMSTRVNSYDLTSGDIIWSCQGMRHGRGDLAYSSPIVAGDLCFVTGGYRGPAISVKLGGKGDVTKSHRLWRKENQPQSIGTGIFVAGHIYRPNAGPGTIECIEPKSGKVKWEARTGDLWGSIVKVGKHAYVTNRKGETIVFTPSPDSFKQVARNPAGGACNATPAFSHGRIYLRLDQGVVAFGK